MSHIPNNAMPHAGPAEGAREEAGPTLKQRAGKLAGKARAHPKTAIAAGAALVAGAVAAAAVPALRGRKKAAGSRSGGGGKRGSKKGG